MYIDKGAKKGPLNVVRTPLGYSKAERMSNIYKKGTVLTLPVVPDLGCLRSVKDNVTIRLKAHV